MPEFIRRIGGFIVAIEGAGCAAPFTPPHFDSDFSAVTGPVENGLPLSAAAEKIAWFAIAADLLDVTADCLPAPDLALILFWHPPAHVIAAVPLKPAARIVGMNPSFLPPDGKRLAGMNAKIVSRGIAALRRQFCADKPIFRKLRCRVGHIFAAENPELQHLLGGEIGLEFWVEVTTGGLRQRVTVRALHFVMHNNGSARHETPDARGIHRDFRTHRPQFGFVTAYEFHRTLFKENWYSTEANLFGISYAKIFGGIGYVFVDARLCAGAKSTGDRCGASTHW